MKEINKRSYRDRTYLYNEYVNKGRDGVNIAREFNVNPTTVYIWLEKHNIQRRCGKEIEQLKFPKSYRDRDWLYRKYITEEYSSKQIASMCKCTDVTIRSWLKKYSIYIRNQVESQNTKRYLEHMVTIRKGKNNPCWRGGTTSLQQLIVANPLYVYWRNLVFNRDDYKCQVCGKTNCTLNAHHIIPKSIDMTKVYVVDNGITLCVPCHNLTKGNELNFAEQFNNSMVVI